MVMLDGRANLEGLDQGRGYPSERVFVAPPVELDSTFDFSVLNLTNPNFRTLSNPLND